MSVVLHIIAHLLLSYIAFYFSRTTSKLGAAWETFGEDRFRSKRDAIGKRRLYRPIRRALERHDQGAVARLRLPFICLESIGMLLLGFFIITPILAIGYGWISGLMARKATEHHDALQPYLCVYRYVSWSYFGAASLGTFLGWKYFFGGIPVLQAIASNRMILLAVVIGILVSMWIAAKKQAHFQSVLWDTQS